MKKTIIYGDYFYEYDFVRQNRQSISLTVFPDMRIAIVAPHDIAMEKVEDFFKKKWLWIERQLTFFRKFQKNSSQKQYVSGENYLYLGRQYKLIVKKSHENRVVLEKGRLLVYTTHAVRNGKKNKEALDLWYKNRADIVFTERFEYVKKKFRYDNAPQLIVREMKKRWGSYTKNNRIILNTRLIHASKKCIDYVIAHELCHIKYKNHDKRFYELLTKKCSNWQKTQEDLEMRFVL